MNRPRIVLADDHLLIREAIRTELEHEFEILAELKDGSAAIDAAEKHLPDVLLLDISLPQVNGLGVTRRVKQGWPNIKIIFVTAQSDHTYVEEAFRAGADGYVLKGKIASELRGAIREVLANRFYRSPVLAHVS